MRKPIVLLLVTSLLGCSETSSDSAEPELVVTLRKEMEALNIDAPEEDAARDIQAAQPKCYSVNGFIRDFPGVTDASDRSYCLAIEINFVGTSDSLAGEEHRELVVQATEYATKYNTYILAHRAAPP